MESKYITTQISRSIGINNWDTIKAYLCILVVISVLGVLGPIPVSNKVQKNPWLSTLSSTTFCLHYINGSTKQGCALLGNDEDNDLSVEDSQTPFKPFKATIGLLVFAFINSHWWEIFSDEIRSFSCVSFFSLLPLRSPPLFL